MPLRLLRCLTTHACLTVRPCLQCPGPHTAVSVVPLKLSAVEGGCAASFAVTLPRQPNLTDTVIRVESLDPANVVVALPVQVGRLIRYYAGTLLAQVLIHSCGAMQAKLTFTPDNWNVPQHVEVLAGEINAGTVA